MTFKLFFILFSFIASAFGILSIFSVLFISGCALPGSTFYAKEVYNCPAQLLTDLKSKLEETCQPRTTPDSK